ncbi:MAG: dynein gamma chain protein [Eggerthellaceae bacterium]|nr:dynein gamma chain protein [Eggerthellaceae bacterium]
MCVNGINAGQFKWMLEQMDDQVALNRRWTHKLYHSAEDAGLEKTAAALKEIQAHFDEVRALLDSAQDAFDKDSAQASNVTVSLV